MKRLIWFLCAVVLGWSGVACAQSVPAPDVIKGKYVYTVPESFDPPLIGRSGVGKIQKAAEKLHFPYYVVLVEQFNGETDDDAAVVIDTLVEKWQEDPDFDSSKSCVFLLSYNPRKYRFLAGSQWEAQLGFERTAHEPYTAIFTRYVQAARKDPQTGIIKMMEAVDHYLYVESDPKTIAMRKEAARKAEVARREAQKKVLEEARIQAARGQLNSQIAAMDALLALEPRFLPANTREYASARDAAYDVSLDNDVNRMLDSTASLSVQTNKLRVYVEAKQLEARQEASQRAATVIAFLCVFIPLLILIVSRGRNYRWLKSELEAQCRSWEEKIANAQPKYLSFEQEREMIIGLRELSGRTKEVYESTTREVDAIFITIGAMQNRIDACKAIASRASFLNPKPLDRAIKDLQSEFTIDTRELGRIALFGPDTRQVTLKPYNALQQLEERFRTTIEQWNHLKKAAEIRYQQAEEVFSQTKLDEMLKSADDYAIPHRWLADHPLFGDDESDRTLYARINEGRINDPVTYLERLEELQQTEARIAERLQRLIESVNATRSQRIDSVPDLAQTILQPQDDPKVTFDAARREDARFTALLASRDDVAEIEGQAAKVRGLYSKCVEQTVMAQAAISVAQQEYEAANTLLSSVSALAEPARQMIVDRQEIHSNLSDARNSLMNGNRFLETGRASVESASSLLSSRRHLDAESAAREATRSLGTAKREFENVSQICKELDEAKRQFEERYAGLESRREQFESRVQRYSGSLSRLHDFNYTHNNSGADYVLLLSQMDKLESSWENEVRVARRRYEEEERRHREAQEAAERRRRAESRNDFWSSSSGSSFGGGSSSSSGASWGGDSSSSGSSSSSSGGSW